jgi:hypothetical protein
MGLGSIFLIATHTIHGWRSDEHNAVQIPWHIWFPATFHPHLKLDLMMMCTQVYDTTRVGKTIVKVRDIHGYPRESHGQWSRVDGADHLIPCHIWGASITRVHCSAFEMSFLCSILECPHQRSPSTHNLEINISSLLLWCFFLLHCHTSLPPLRVGRCHTNAESPYETATGVVTPP